MTSTPLDNPPCGVWADRSDSLSPSVSTPMGFRSRSSGLVLQEMRGERMPKRVARRVFGNPSPPNRRMHCPLNDRFVQMVAMPQARPSVDVVERRVEHLRQHGHAILLSFAAPDGDFPPAEVEILDAHLETFEESQPRTVQQRANQAWNPIQDFLLASPAVGRRQNYSSPAAAGRRGFGIPETQTEHLRVPGEWAMPLAVRMRWGRVQSAGLARSELEAM